MKHIPVLKNEVLAAFKYLEKDKSGYFVDCTLGAGNHSISLAKESNENVTFVGIDKDPSAQEIARENIEKNGLTERFTLVNDDFKNIKEIVGDLSDEREVVGVLMDLGVSSMQLDQKERGFSFADPEAELDMRMNPEQEISAQTVLNIYPEARLAWILKNYGEEKFARNIARNICIARRHHKIEKVSDFLYAIALSIPEKCKKMMRVHFATRSFQAIRIEVNQELENLESTIKDAISQLSPGSRIAIISFHSLEDRIVKNTLRDLARDCICPQNAPICNCDYKPQVKIISNKPITASDEEIRQNPRSRSAKLRVAERV